MSLKSRFKKAIKKVGKVAKVAAIAVGAVYTGGALLAALPAGAGAAILSGGAKLAGGALAARFAGGRGGGGGSMIEIAQAPPQPYMYSSPFMPTGGPSDYSYGLSSSGDSYGGGTAGAMFSGAAADGGAAPAPSIGGRTFLIVGAAIAFVVALILMARR